MTAYNRLVRPREGLNPFEGDDDEEEYHDANGEGIYQEITEQWDKRLAQCFSHNITQ